MKFMCPHCRQRLESGVTLMGTTLACPACNKELMVPVEPTHVPPPAPAEVTPAPPVRAPAVPPPGGRSIAQYLAAQQIAGGVELETPGDRPLVHPASAMLPANEGEKYEEGEVVSEGGMGVVLKAKDRNLCCTVAMKVMRDPLHARKDQILRFIEEAQITAQLAHPSIVPVHELALDVSGREVYYTMKFIEGRTLKNILERIANGDLMTIEEYPLAHLLTIFQKVCDAVAFAHSKRVVHRDLKPENIMVGAYGEVQVMDWGLAKVLPKKKGWRVRRQGETPALPTGLENEAPGAARREEYLVQSARGDAGRTLSGSIMGTPGYMAPEQAQGQVEKVDERADVYSLGSILFNILTLRPPIQGDDLTETMGKIITGNIPHPSTYNPTAAGRKRGTKRDSAFGVGKNPSVTIPASDGTIPLAHCPEECIPESLSAVAMKALATDPDTRYQTVLDLQKDIDAYQTGFATAAEGADLLKQIVLLIRRHKGIFAALAACLLIIVTVVGTSFVRVNQEKDKVVAALADFRTEQQNRQADRKQSAPWLVQSAKQLIEQGDLRSAVGLADSAVQYDPTLAEAHILKILLSIQNGDYSNALAQSDRFMECCPTDPDGQKLRNFCSLVVQKWSGQALRGALCPLVVRHGMPNLAARFAKSMEALLPVYQAKIEAVWPKWGSKLKLAADGSLEMDLASCIQITSLAPLQGMPIKSLSLYGCTGVGDLDPLKGMPLTVLSLYGTMVSDLSALKGMPLTSLDLRGTRVNDLGPLGGMPLTSLMADNTKVSNLTPLKGIALTSLYLSGCWVRDLSPLAGMPLKELHVDSTMVGDLTPLAGMPLTTLWLSSCVQIADFSPLTNLPLRELRIDSTKITDLSPLTRLPLTTLWMGKTPVRDLTPLQGMPLTVLALSGCNGVSNLMPLQGMPLTTLSLDGVPAADLTPLRRMKTLTTLYGSDIGGNWRKKICEALTLGDIDTALQVAQTAKEKLSDYADVPFATNDLLFARKLAGETLPGAIAMRSKDAYSIPASIPAYGGHHYLYVPVTMTWSQAKLLCEKAGGHLATITSPAEKEFVAGLRLPTDYCWLGGTREEAGEWVWVTKEPWKLTFWNSANKYPLATDSPYLAMWATECSSAAAGEWFNSDGTHACHILIEWDR